MSRNIESKIENNSIKINPILISVYIINNTLILFNEIFIYNL